jgi:transposase
MSKTIHKVSLTDPEVALLQNYVATGVHSARSIRRAQILLAAHHGQSDPWIATHVQVSKATVYNIRRRYCQDGVEAALNERPRPGAPRKLDGRGEARFTAIACSQPPDGRQRWTIRLLADKLVAVQLVDSVSPASVQAWLKKTGSNPG